MELEILQKAKELEASLEHLKWSKQNLHDCCILKKDVSLRIYINDVSNAFVVPPPYGEKVTNYINDIFEEVIKEKEQQLKEL